MNLNLTERLTERLAQRVARAVIPPLQTATYACDSCPLRATVTDTPKRVRARLAQIEQHTH